MKIEHVCGAALALALTTCGPVETDEPAGVGETTSMSEPLPVVIPRSEQLEIYSDILGRAYEIQVKLPPSYGDAESADRVYPVLYLNDAPYNFQVAAGITHLPMNAETIEEFIIVGIGYETGAHGMDSRTRDYTPSINPEFERVTGEAAAYLEFIADEVIPELEQRYRVDVNRRVLGGHSFGGLFGGYVLFHRPELFSSYILSSPSFWFHNGVAFEYEKAFAETHDDLEANVYMGIGALEHPAASGGTRNEMVQQALDMEAALAARGYESLTLKAGIVPGANHETAFPAVLMSGILWHFATDRDVAYAY